MTADAGFGLIVNPNAHANRNERRRDALRRAFEPLGEVFESTDLAELRPTVARWQREGRHTVAISGGDGTLHHVLAALRAGWTGPLPRLMLLRGGTMAIAYDEIGGPDALVAIDAVRRAVDRGAQLPTCTLATLSTPAGLSFNLGLGVFADLPYEVQKRRASGRSAVHRLIARAAASVAFGGRFAARALTGFRGEVWVDDEPTGFVGLRGLYACTLDRCALPALRGFYRAGRPKHHFRVLSVACGARRVLASAVPFAIGVRAGVDPGIDVRAARRIEIRPIARTRYMADGEIYALDAPLRVQAGPVLDVIDTGALVAL